MLGSRAERCRGLARGERAAELVGSRQQPHHKEGELRVRIHVAGRETTGCCAAYLGTIAKQDAPIIERIRRAAVPSLRSIVARPELEIL